MMEKLLNYAAQAEKDMQQYTLNTNVPPAIAKVALYAHTIIKNAVHFQIPDEGIILDDELRGIQNTVLHLPFDHITIAFESTGHGVNGDTAHGGVLVSAYTMPYKDVHPGIRDNPSDNIPPQDWIACIVMDRALQNKKWIPPLATAFIPVSDWGKVVRDKLLLTVGTRNTTVCSAVDMLPEECHRAELTAQFGASRVLNLLEALSCRNVKHAPLMRVDKNTNNKRIRLGKVPFYEVHTLTIDAPNNVTDITGASKNTGTKHRQHLVRGHIRRLQSGENTWVNSHVRGDAALGNIAKKYNVRKAANDNDKEAA
jgi:hypothetical protein